MFEPNLSTVTPFMRRHRFLILISLSIFIVMVLVWVSMGIYNSSGAAQLDLSRPGYKSVRSQSINNDNDFQSYSSTGSISEKSISEFNKLYSEQAQKAKAVDAFGGDPLSLDALVVNISQSTE
jgi:hypothetical protein